MADKIDKPLNAVPVVTSDDINQIEALFAKMSNGEIKVVTKADLAGVVAGAIGNVTLQKAGLASRNMAVYVKSYNDTGGYIKLLQVNRNWDFYILFNIISAHVHNSQTIFKTAYLNRNGNSGVYYFNLINTYGDDARYLNIYLDETNGILYASSTQYVSFAFQQIAGYGYTPIGTNVGDIDVSGMRKLI